MRIEKFRQSTRLILWTALAFCEIFKFSFAISFLPEFLWYKMCADSPPGFSPGCMNNVTVNLGEKAVFNCQVDPRCHVQYLYWFHERGGGKRLIKTGRNSSEPYIHEIPMVYEEDLGRYFCVIGNILGETECSAYLIPKNDTVKSLSGNLPVIFVIALIVIFSFQNERNRVFSC